MFEKYFQMDNLVDRRGYRSHFFIRLLLHHKTFKIEIRIVACSILLLCTAVHWKMAKNDQVHEGGKVERSNVTPKAFKIVTR